MLTFATNLPKSIPIIINFYAVIFTESKKTLKIEDPTDIASSILKSLL